MRTISIRLDDRTDALFREFCERLGLSQTEALKAAIEHLAERHRPMPAELAAQLELIGGFRSGEGDLAANHSQRVNEQLRTKLQRDSQPAPSARGRAGSGAPTRRKAGTNLARDAPAACRHRPARGVVRCRRRSPRDGQALI